MGWIDFGALYGAGYRAVCFDKDNTLTLPYQNTLHPAARDVLEECRRVFGPAAVAVLSNSAGSADDRSDAQARETEAALGLPVIRHRYKKPMCAADVVRHFGVAPARVVVVGDRLMTDVFMANGAGMLSIHTAPLAPRDKDDNRSAVRVRRLEQMALDWAGRPFGRADLQARFIKGPA